MSNTVMVIGESGTGKSTSLEDLDPRTTALVRVIGKPLPFRGWAKNYTECTTKNPQGNMLSSDKHVKIMAFMDGINKTRPEINMIVVDDYQYLMVNELMRRTAEAGFQKFTEIANHAWAVVDKANQLRDDLTVVFTTHSQTDDRGCQKAKTVGKMIDQVITLEGLFTVVLYTAIKNGQYLFSTQNNGSNTCKSPKGMFEDVFIPNNLEQVRETINDYYGYDDKDIPESTQREEV